MGSMQAKRPFAAGPPVFYSARWQHPSKEHSKRQHYFRALGTPIDPSLTAKIVRLPATDGLVSKVPPDDRWLDDVVDEAVFVDQRQVGEEEQKHFEQAIGQLERFVEDENLVCRRERASIAKLPPLRGLDRRPARRGLK